MDTGRLFIGDELLELRDGHDDRLAVYLPWADESSLAGFSDLHQAGS